MSRIAFTLQPFAAAAAPEGLRLDGNLVRRGTSLTIDYRLRGPLAGLRIPAAAAPARRDGLWQATCLEAFLAVPGEPGYWEVNLSPSGEWNVYRLDGYRLNLRPEPAVAALPCRRRDAADELALELTLPLGDLLPAGQSLELGITAVLQSSDGELGYWALLHPGPEPDFHRREGFQLRLPPA